MSPRPRETSTMSANQRVDPRRAGRAEQLDLGVRQIVLVEDAGPYGVVDVVVDVGDPVDQPHDPPLERRRLRRPGVIEDPVANRLGQVEPVAVALELVDDAQRVPVVLKAVGTVVAQRLVERLLADVAERRVAEVVPEADRLGQILVEPERPGHGAGDEAGLERVREPGPIVIALGGDEHLRLVLEPPERLRVRDPVAIALKRRPHGAVVLRLAPTGRIRPGRRLPQKLGLPALDALAQAGVDRFARFAQSGVSIRRAAARSSGSAPSRITR